MQNSDIPLRPPPPPKYVSLNIAPPPMKERLYPKSPPFSAREYYQKKEEEKHQKYKTISKRSPRFRPVYTMYGIEKETEKKNEP